jgi:hypothetical protein
VIGPLATVFSFMVEHTASAEVLVSLFDKGTDVWRPVRAQHLAGDVYRIIGEVPDPEDEHCSSCRGQLFGAVSSFLAVHVSLHTRPSPIALPIIAMRRQPSNQSMKLTARSSAISFSDD